MFESVLDDDFKKSLENEKNSYNIEEQISINNLFRSTEAIADGMTEDSSSDGTENENSEDQNNTESSDNEEMDNDLSDDNFDDGGEGEGDEGGEEDSSDDSTTSSDSESSKSAPKISGKNPFSDINSKDKVYYELNELKDQIDKVLLKLGQFKSNVVVKKLVELASIVEDALKNAYTVPLQDSLIRYSMYVTQFEDLISELAKYFESNKSAQ